MKTQVSPAVVGAFVLGACVIGVLALLSFGGLNFLKHRQRFVVYFEESTEGLNVGSSVRLQGVGVGRVAGLSVRYDRANNRSAVAVLCEFDRDTITDSRGQMIDVANSQQLQSLVDNGLRAQLVLQSFATGQLYVELDFLDPKENPAVFRENGRQLPEIPSVPSIVSEYLKSASGLLTEAGEVLAKLKRIDFEGLSKNIDALLTDTRQQIDGLDLKGLTDQWKQTGQSFQALAESPELKKALTDLDGAIADLHETLQHVDTQVDANGKSVQDALARVDGTLQQFEAAAQSVQYFVDAQQGLGDQATATLAQVASAAESVRRLADFIERNPNALITGRKLPQ